MVTIIVSIEVSAPLVQVWRAWTDPSEITQWCFATPTWHCPAATNDLRSNGKFSTTMAAKDGSTSFEMKGTYTQVQEHSLIEYVMEDGRIVTIQFTETESGVRINETFDAEETHSAEQQKQGWQAILQNFKKYVEDMKK